MQFSGIMLKFLQLVNGLIIYPAGKILDGF